MPKVVHINFWFLVNCIRFSRSFYLIKLDKIRGFNDFIVDYKGQCVKLKSRFSDKINLSNNLFTDFNVVVDVPRKLFIFNDKMQLKKFDFKLIPDLKFIVKANHGSGMNIIVQENQILEKKQIKEISRWFNFPSHYVNNEIHYNLFQKGVFIEELIGENVTDYKLFCYQGKCRVIQLDFDRYINHTRNLYSQDWELLDFEFVYENKFINIDKPKQMDEMIILSEKIASNFEFVRVDWFLVEDRFYLGELTFHPEGGVGPFKNKQQDIDFLNYLKSS